MREEEEEYGIEGANWLGWQDLQRSNRRRKRKEGKKRKIQASRLKRDKKRRNGTPGSQLADSRPPTPASEGLELQYLSNGYQDGDH